jgi:Domain of unknown function (DUF4124)/Bacterial Ig domain
MIRQLVLASVLCSFVALALADVYRKRDADGNIIFSDTPSEGAERVKLKETTIVPSLRPTLKLSPDNRPAVDDGYESVAIASPANEGTLRNTSTVTVSVATVPALRSDIGHMVQFYVDGKAHGPASVETSITLEELPRGAHTLVAAIVTSDGREVARSAQSTFYLHKQSVRKPTKAKKAAN